MQLFPYPKRMSVLVATHQITQRANLDKGDTAALSEARTTLPESSSRPLPAKTAHSRNLAHASLETAVRKKQNGAVTDLADLIAVPAHQSSASSFCRFKRELLPLPCPSFEKFFK